MAVKTYLTNGAYGAHLLDVAEETVAEAAPRPSAHALQHVLATLDMAEALRPAGTTGSLAGLFDAYAPGGAPALRRHFDQFYEVVALPGAVLDPDALRPGDLLIRRALGEGTLAHAAFIASPDTWSPDELAAHAFSSESLHPGHYVQVLEAGTRPHARADRYTRRLTDEAHRLPHDQVLLRLRAPGQPSAAPTHDAGWETDEDLPIEAGARTTFRVRNRYIRTDPVVRALVVIDDGAGNRIEEFTNRFGIFRADVSSLPDGTYNMTVNPARTTTANVGPAIASGTAPPARIWRSLSTTVRVRGGRIRSSPSARVSVSGRTVTIKIQPVWMRTPKARARPSGTSASLIIVHHTGGTSTTSALNTFMNPSADQSIHYVIDPAGNIIKMAQDTQRSNHAGRSHWAGRNGVNDFSIGIELVHRSGAYPTAQMDALMALLGRIRSAFPSIPARGIVGHSDIATSGSRSSRRLGRKGGDPGRRFNWGRLEGAGLGLVPAAMSPPPPLYGGFFAAVPGGMLRRGDNDRRQVYGGRRRTSFSGLITELQTDLSNIGYFCPVTGTFNRATEAAVKMLQEHFARRITLRAALRGRVNLDTATLIKTL